MAFVERQNIAVGRAFAGAAMTIGVENGTIMEAAESSYALDGMIPKQVSRLSLTTWANAQHEAIRLTVKITMALIPPKIAIGQRPSKIVEIVGVIDHLPSMDGPCSSATGPRKKE